MFPPSAMKQYRRQQQRLRRKRRKMGATARRHKLRLSPVRQAQGGLTRSSTQRSSHSSVDKTAPMARSDAREVQAARSHMFAIKRRIVDRLLQREKGLMNGNIRQDGRLLRKAYCKIDADVSGSVDYDELEMELGPGGLNIGLRPQEFHELCIALDKDGSGDISVNEFLSELMAADKPEQELFIDRGRRIAIEHLQSRVNDFPTTECELIPAVETPHRAVTAKHQRRSRQQSHGTGSQPHSFQHPLETQRPYTSNSEYGNSHRSWTGRSTSTSRLHTTCRLQGEPARILRQRGTGKDFSASPKFAENLQTWVRVGVGQDGTIKESALFLPEQQRRNHISASALPASPLKLPSEDTKPDWARAHRLVPLDVKLRRREEGANRMHQRAKTAELYARQRDLSRVRTKTLQQLHYFQNATKSQLLMNRRRGIGIGKAGMRSPTAMRQKMGQLATMNISLA